MKLLQPCRTEISLISEILWAPSILVSLSIDRAIWKMKYCKVNLKSSCWKKTSRSSWWSNSSLRLIIVAWHPNMETRLCHSWARSRFRILYKIISSRGNQDNRLLKTLNFHISRDKFTKILRSKLICWLLTIRIRLIRNLINSTKYTDQVRKINWRS